MPTRRGRIRIKDEERRRERDSDFVFLNASFSRMTTATARTSQSNSRSIPTKEGHYVKAVDVECDWRLNNGRFPDDLTALVATTVASVRTSWLADSRVSMNSILLLLLLQLVLVLVLVPLPLSLPRRVMRNPYPWQPRLHVRKTSLSARCLRNRRLLPTASRASVSRSPLSLFVGRLSGGVLTYPAE